MLNDKFNHNYVYAMRNLNTGGICPHSRTRLSPPNIGEMNDLDM